VTKRFSFTILILLFCASVGKAQPQMRVSTDKQFYSPGDSLRWQCELVGFGPEFGAVTLQLWIDDVASGERWKFRFPILNGYGEGAIRIADDMPAGRYAINFLLQQNFFRLSGRLRGVRADDSALRYFALFKKRETMVETVRVARDGRFSIGGLLFEDTAMISFSRVAKGGAPDVRIVTALDSSFKPAVPVITRLISVMDVSGGAASNNPAQARTPYHFDTAGMWPAGGLEMMEVEVRKRRGNRLVADYEAAYVSSAFRSADEITLDALTNDDILKAGDIYQFLSARVPGLMMSSNPQTGVQEVRWRGNAVAMYVDEFPVGEGAPLTVQPAEVALVKVFRAGNGPLTGGGFGSGGAIAIYTRVGPYARAVPGAPGGSRFFVRGYDGLSDEWRP